MNGRDLLLSALKREKTPRAPWLPFIGVHGGAIIGATAKDYLQSSDLLVKGLLKAQELYQPDGLPIAFDLQMEAEVLGCSLKWADEVPPSVTSHPLEKLELSDLPEFSAEKGRFPIVLDALDRVKKEIGDKVALFGLLCGPFTLALHLKGNEIFLDMYDEPEETQKLLSYCADICKKTAQMYIDHGADVIALVDPMTSQISPAHFEEFVTPAVNDVFDFIRDGGAFSSLFVCGDATRVLEVMCQTHCDQISIDENISMDQLRELAGKYDKAFGGNLKLTAVLLLGNEDDSRMDTIRCLESGGDKSFILAPGCDLPYGTPVENLQAVAEMILDDYQRSVTKTRLVNYQGISVEEVHLPDYPADKEKVYIDVLTLDSTACAPCQYMMEAVVEAVKHIDGPVQITEHKIKGKAGIGAMMKLGVKSIPTICIDGEVMFSSIIPNQPHLIEAINKKFGLKK